jgi:hypothetical protein
LEHDTLLKQVRPQILPAMTRRHLLATWIVDHTGFPTTASHSVGGTRLYCGHLGKQKNCRVSVSVSLATEQTSISAAYQRNLIDCCLYLHGSGAMPFFPKPTRGQSQKPISLFTYPECNLAKRPRAATGKNRTVQLSTQSPPCTNRSQPTSPHPCSGALVACEATDHTVALVS